MDKISLNLVCSSIALLGGGEELVNIVRSLNEEATYENITEIFDWNIKKRNELIENKPMNLHSILEFSERVCEEGNWDIKNEGDLMSILIDGKLLATYHKSSEHLQKQILNDKK